ncbi:hypothetical protein D917_01101 [Trichinella nativa]|uniref:Uncharacterized protein n=1 Tax=Trichinella nativa TaxID=6335 RepID=A0A1Y3EV50_9BILA|nr:hypothetical protein D917_01101 [Trichinella nativa]
METVDSWRITRHMDGLDSLSTLMWNAMHPLNVILVDSIALLGLWRRHRTNMKYSNQTKIITGSSRSSIQSGIASLLITYKRFLLLLTLSCS